MPREAILHGAFESSLQGPETPSRSRECKNKIRLIQKVKKLRLCARGIHHFGVLVSTARRSRRALGDIVMLSFIVKGIFLHAMISTGNKEAETIEYNWSDH